MYRYIDLCVQVHLFLFTGTMSGGGGKVCKGRMGSAVVTDIDPKELQSMETKLQKVRLRYNEVSIQYDCFSTSTRK